MTIEEIVRDAVRTTMREVFAERAETALEKPATYAQAAKFAECSVSTIQDWVKRKVLPATGKGKLRRVLLSDVAKVLAGTPTPPPQTSAASRSRMRSEEILAGLGARRSRR